MRYFSTNTIGNAQGKVQNSVYFDALAVSYSKKQVGKQRGAKYTEHHGVVFEFLQVGLIHLRCQFLGFVLLVEVQV